MKPSLIKYPVCFFKGHRLETPSIIDFMDKRNYLTRCSRCGLYHAYSYMSGISLTVSKRYAMKLKRKFDKEFGKVRMDGTEV